MEFLSPGNLVKRYEPVHEILILIASTKLKAQKSLCVVFSFLFFQFIIQFPVINFSSHVISTFSGLNQY